MPRPVVPILSSPRALSRAWSRAVGQGRMTWARPSHRGTIARPIRRAKTSDELPDPVGVHPREDLASVLQDEQNICP